MANPFVAASETQDTQATSTTLPKLIEYAYDFTHDVFLYDTNGKIKTVEELEALKVWVYKALKTERWRYEAYTHGLYNEKAPYGCELEQFIGQTNHQANADLIKIYIQRGLEVNPYIIKINSIKLTNREHDEISFDVDLTSIYGRAVFSYTIGK